MQTFHQKILFDELAVRSSKNQAYSMRAFARSLQVNSAIVSRVLSGQRSLSSDVAERICDKLNLPVDQRRRFIESVAVGRRSSHKKSMDRKSNASVESEVERISAEQFRVISDWFHYAILESTFIKCPPTNEREIAKLFGITKLQAKLALERLVSLGLLEKKYGKLIKTKSNITTANKNVTTPELRRHQQQILEKALASLQNDPLERRNMNSMTMAIDPDKLHLAKAYIEKFMNDMCALLETGNRREVYQLGLCLFPLQQNKEF